MVSFDFDLYTAGKLNLLYLGEYLLVLNLSKRISEKI